MSFFASFRIVAWQMLYFHRDRNETLHPDYFNCLRCVRDEKDFSARPIQCPRCELTIKLEYYKDEIKRLIKERVGSFPKGYTLSDLIHLYGQVSSILSRNHNRILKSWDVKTAELARILLSEREQARSVDDWAHREKMKQK